MTRIECRFWNGQYENRGVLQRLKKKITRKVSMGQCVLLDFESTRMTESNLRELTEGWPVEKVRACGCRETLPFPLPPGIESFSCLK